jgi:glycosyltransferase involved in cell wall biosynthesis
LTELVSFVVPARDAADTIAVTLESLLRQTYRHLEVVVVDDGSTDRTADVVRSFAARDARVRLIVQPQRGGAAARNRGIRAASGAFVAPVDADDLWGREAAARFVEQLRRGGPETAVVYAWSTTIDEEGRPTGRYRASRIAGRVSTTLACHNFIGNASATLIRRDALLEVGLYDDAFHRAGRQGCEDWDLYLRLADRFRFGAVPAFLVGYRRRAASMSADAERMSESHRMLLDRWYDRHPGAPGFVRSVSTSSFALYLAQEARARGDQAGTRRWAGAAWAAAPLIASLRPAWHACWWLPRRKAAARTAGPRARRTRLAVVLVVQSVFHRLVTALAGSPASS